MQEQWIRWEPIEGLFSKYDLDIIIDDEKGLKIIFECDQKKVNVFFKHGAVSYIKTNETLRSYLIGSLSKEYGSVFYASWTFFKVENSEYLKWLSAQSCSISDYYHLQHFSFIVDGSILDIAASVEPIVEHIEL
jgi:hypothetical protein